ncbi:hypothetical protein TNCV_1109691 [Trichonephila clavipes]|nr:hypothetical protein TNCV_1109691 [Trichonephila clavipes]
MDEAACKNGDYYGDNSGHMAREASLHPISEKYMWNDCGLYPASIYTRAFGDGPRNFEPWSSDVDDT